MSELHRHNIQLSVGQKRKLRTAYKRRNSTVISLKPTQMSGGSDQIMLSGSQHKAVIRAVRNNRGLRLTLNYDQLVQNIKGGLLREMLEMVETAVPGGKTIISPLVKRKIAPLLKEHFIPWLKELIDNELDTIIAKDPKGAGLKRCITKKLDTLLKKINPLSLGEIEQYAKKLGIRNFRGVFMRQMLPGKPRTTECGVINLGDLRSNGTHWTCYMKNGRWKIYFDSYGDARPPLELVNYLGGKGLGYETERIQEFDDPPICGHLCLEVLRRYSNGEDWETIMKAISDDKYVWQQWFSI